MTSRRLRRITIVLIAAICAATVGVGLANSVTNEVTNVAVIAQNSSGNALSGGPGGAGIDFKITGNVANNKTWQSTRWRVAGDPSWTCLNTGDQNAGSNRSVTLNYDFNNSEQFALRGNSGSTLFEFELFTGTNSCSGEAAATTSKSVDVTAPGNNPDLSVACQNIKVALVLDASGSIDSADAEDEVVSAAYAFANGLSGTGAKMGLSFFNTNATTKISPYSVIDTTFISGAFKTAMDSYSGQNWTNWRRCPRRGQHDDELRQAEPRRIRHGR